MRTSLDHEKLDVYQTALEFITWTLPLLERLPSNASVRNQLAEGNGKFTSADRCRYFDNARGSALECSACLDVNVAKRFAKTDDGAAGKAVAVKMVLMLFGMIRANSDVRLFETAPVYEAMGTNRNRIANDGR